MFIQNKDIKKKKTWSKYTAVMSSKFVYKPFLRK